MAKEKSRTELKKELQGIIKELANAGACTFWACPGPNAPILEGATCRVCYAIKHLRQLKKDL